MSSTPQGVKTHLSSSHEPQGTIDILEVCFYLNPSLRIMTFIKYVQELIKYHVINQLIILAILLTHS